MSSLILNGISVTKERQVLIVRDYLNAVYEEEIRNLENKFRGYVRVYKNAEDFVMWLGAKTEECKRMRANKDIFTEIVERFNPEIPCSKIRNIDNIIVLVKLNEDEFNVYEIESDEILDIIGQVKLSDYHRDKRDKGSHGLNYKSLSIDKFIVGELSYVMDVNKNKTLNGIKKLVVNSKPF